MPIVTIELVEDSESANPAPAQLRSLCDELGQVFASGPAGTWLKFRRLPAASYAENSISPETTAKPVFVEIIKAELADSAALAAEARTVCRIVAQACNRPAENVHVIYQPPARGRIAFGGELLQ